jgi:hypothetical protein
MREIGDWERHGFGLALCEGRHLSAELDDNFAIFRFLPAGRKYQTKGEKSV